MNIHTKGASSTVGAISPEEWQARVDLAAVYRLVARHGWDDVIYNDAGTADSRRHPPTFFRLCPP